MQPADVFDQCSDGLERVHIRLYGGIGDEDERLPSCLLHFLFNGDKEAHESQGVQRKGFGGTATEKWGLRGTLDSRFSSQPGIDCIDRGVHQLQRINCQSILPRFLGSWRVRALPFKSRTATMIQ